MMVLRGGVRAARGGTMAFLRPGDRLLFQGDSITDAGRRRDGVDGTALGNGYVAQIAARLHAERSDLGVTVLNRGVSGNRTVELLARWQEDVVALRPTALSIFIGVNDVWRRLGAWNGQGPVSEADFAANLRTLTERNRAAGVDRVVWLSPTTIDGDDGSDINRVVGEYAELVRAHAAAVGDRFIDLRTPLLAARAARPDLEWTPDGCHPSAAGHALLASVWWNALVEAD